MDRFRRGTEGFQRRKEFLIGSLIGFCVVLLALLAAVVAPQPRAALAQSDPRVVISVGGSTMIQGQVTWVHASFYNMPQNPNDDGAFGNISFRYYFERSSDGSWTNADSCTEDLVGSNLYITTWWRSPWEHGASSFALSTTCPVGSYRLRVSVTNRDDNTELVSGTHDFTVSLGPSVTVDMPTGPYYRGTSFNPTIKFNDLVQGADYTYSAYLMARNPANYAEICEGTGLERNKTFALNNASGNPVQKTVTVTDNCPRNEYTLKVKIKDSDDRERGSKDVDFEVETDPNATPSVGVTMSESSPVAPGTEFDIIFNFYDIQHGKLIKHLETMTDKTTNQPVGRNACGGGLVGWGHDVQATFNSNPLVIEITIPSDCPAGDYRVASQIQDSSGSEIVSGSIDFVIGYPDLTPTAPSISGYTAKQNAPFSQQLPEGSGGDGTLTYEATPLPAGLSFIATTRTITGTPSGTGTTTVRYTVTDSDSDSAHVDFDITVNADLTPTAPSVPGYTAKQNSLFTQQLPEGSGGDGTLTYEATPLPAGLSFIASTRTITGTPTGTGTTTVQYTVTDSDGDSDSVDFNITVNADLTPAAPSVPGYTAKQNSLFTQQLPAGSGGDGTLTYEATPLPAGLSFIASTRTITGTPTGTGATTVQYTVTDSDGDSDSVEFNITVAADLMPTLEAISNANAKLTRQFTLQLPEGTGGDGDLDYEATGLPPGLSFVESTRTITGTPTTANSYVVTYTATDDDDDVAQQTFTIHVFAMPSLTEVSNITATKDELFTLELTEVSGGRAPFDYEVSDLPTGLSFVEASLTIAGTPTVIEEADVTFSVEDADGDTASEEFKITVSEGDTEPTFPIEIQDYTLRVGNPFAVTLPAATGGNTPYTYTLSGHPSTLAFDPATRQLKGTPDTATEHQVTYTATDRDQDEVLQVFTLKVDADKQPSEPSIVDFHLKVGDSLLAELPAGASGDPPYTYSITTLPSGLTFNSNTRQLSGRPDAAGVTQVTYTVYDEDSDTATKNFTINVYALPDLTAVSDTPGKKGELFTLELPEATGGRPPLRYSVTGLPAGLDFIATTRVITGTPTQVEVGNVTYKVVDSDDDQDSISFKITVADLDQRQDSNVGNNNNGNNDGGNIGGVVQTPPALTLGDTTGLAARVDEQFTQQLPAANGGTPPYQYSITTLPAGLSFTQSSHTISGIPTEAGSTNVTYTVTDADSNRASDDFTITVNPAPLTLGDTTGFSVTVGQLFTQQLPAASGGSPPYAYGVTTLPAGLTFVHSTRTITGTPSVAETKVVTYTVSDGNRNSARDAFTITVNEDQTTQPGGSGGDSAVPPGTLQLKLAGTKEFNATVGVQYTQQLPAATGGSAPYAYGVTVLPAGLRFEHATRTIAGSPTTPETRVMTYSVTDGTRTSASDTFTITVAAAPINQPGGTGGGGTQDPLQLSLGQTKEFTATVGTRFTQQLPAASGGSAPYAYGVTTLPSGLDFLLATRTITGTPTAAETRTVTYSVTDGAQVSASEPFTITVISTQVGPPGQPGGGGDQGGKSPGGTPGGSNQGGSNQGSSNQGSKKNSGSSGNQQKYTPPSSYSPPSNQQSWSPGPVPVAITIPDWLNVRKGPGVEYEALSSVPAGTRAGIHGRDPADNWFQVRIDALNDLAWICQDLARVEGSLASVRLLQQWEIDLIPKLSDGPVATTTPAIMNVRAGPGLDYEILTTVTKGTQATIIGIGPNSQWYMVTLDALDRPAWLYASLTTVNGFLGGVKQYTLAELNGYTYTEVGGTDTCGANPYAITTPAIMNVRNGPGLSYDIVTTVVQGTRADIIGIGPLDEWFLVRLANLDEPAWIYRGLTTVVGSLAGVNRVDPGQGSQPNVVTNVERPVAVSYPSLVNIRVGPGLTYPVLKTVRQGTRAEIIGLSPDANWYLVEIDGMSQLGWIREDLTVLVGNLHNVKRINAAELAMLPVAIVDTPTLNVRTGPGLGYPLVTTISEGTWAQIIGVNAQTDWFQVKLHGVTGQTWVYRNLTHLAGLLTGVTQISTSAVAAEYDPALHETTILESASTVASASTQQVVVNSITVALSLPANGNINLEVSWTDAEICTDHYQIYYRSNADSTTYFSLENAVLATASNSKSLSFLTLPDSSLISAWCGTHNRGRQIAEVQIDPTEEGAYSSLPSQQETGAVAVVP